LESYQQRSGGAIFASDLSKQAEKEYRDRDVTLPKVTRA
jgi:hypothetical protein